ncbi:MAG: hypothetical protein QM778_03530 [Myxococcales bacterium]
MPDVRTSWASSLWPRVGAATLAMVLTSGCDMGSSSPSPRRDAAPDDDGSNAESGDGDGDDDRAPPLPHGDAGPPLGGADAGADAGPDALPDAAAPCGEDLDFVGGHVRADVGATQQLDVSGRDLGQPGPYPLFAQDLSVPIQPEMRTAAGQTIVEPDALTLNATLYGPAAEGSSTTLAPGVYPLLFVLPGFQANYALYAELSNHFASHGFIVLGVDTQGSSTSAQHDREALQLQEVLDWILAHPSFGPSIDASKSLPVGTPRAASSRSIWRPSTRAWTWCSAGILRTRAAHRASWMPTSATRCRSLRTAAP